MEKKTKIKRDLNLSSGSQKFLLKYCTVNNVIAKMVDK